VDDDKAAPGQARKEPGERAVTQVPITVVGSMAIAELDESFDEVLVVTISPDGKLTYSEVHGVHAADARVKQEPKPSPAAPILEEK
jgi:hypothetical protein